MAEHDDGGLTSLVMQCAFAVLAGQPSVTISTTSKLPAGFPRGELLSVGSNGSHNYSVHPVKALAWIHSLTSRRAEANRKHDEAHDAGVSGRAKPDVPPSDPDDLQKVGD